MNSQSYDYILHTFTRPSQTPTWVEKRGRGYEALLVDEELFAIDGHWERKNWDLVFLFIFSEVKRKFGLYRNIKISAIGRISYFPISHTQKLSI